MSSPHYETSKITGRTYDIFSIVRILNIKQVIYYMKCNLEVMDIEISADRKTGEPILVFCFDREKSKPVFDMWCKKKERETNDKANLY